ncbi:hypothetical protein ABNB59_01285 [Paenibacillus larvae]|uniref:Uncharacterized protein n=1 Tax=Paenibacillus larvae TaxID=1464 RepID=A0AAP5N2T6_9BACL|nr:hypothetical protein [Paenibacillus larvae]MCY7475282.1 hypothetical protein [Paenibacillus larvae]MCY7488464.1 hypothetical protein [Paenibacillus larvae]MCY7519854.1 hypothetical protein [Paenibacillus larvae]MCY9499782.1 hypothetical protein [Paenibacillus larvae]MCY9511477.1 hypothetical protein [Paenibacillus larvae]
MTATILIKSKKISYKEREHMGKKKPKKQGKQHLRDTPSMKDLFTTATNM